MDPVTVILLLLGGIVAGFVNTVAGGGSVVTLPILIEVAGLPATVANGTNRVAILLQNIAGVRKFSKGGVLPARRVLPLIPPTIAGAVAGAWSASQISPEAMKNVFAFVIVLVAVSVLVKPKKWLKDREEDALKQRVIAAVTTQKQCTSRSGAYRFVQAKNLNAFLMLIERAPSRPRVDRCVELRLTLECLGAR